jgi:hypothetical protein
MTPTEATEAMNVEQFPRRAIRFRRVQGHGDTWCHDVPTPLGKVTAVHSRLVARI